MRNLSKCICWHLVYYTSKKRNLFICEHTPFGSVLLKIDLLELHTDQFSALEPFPIPNLLLDFSQQGATKQKVSLECVLNKEDHFISKVERWMRVFNFAFWKPYSFQNFNSVRIGWSWFGTLALHPWIAELVMFTHNKRNVQSLNACNLRVFDYGSSNTLQPIIYRCYLVVVFFQNTYPPNGRQLD